MAPADRGCVRVHFLFLPSGRLRSQVPEFHALPVIQQVEDVLTRISSVPELDAHLDSTFF
jgi:hypothetical protein